jgi:predicted AAA+ superfamily ATPase
MFRRDAASTVAALAAHYPIVAITGPRQSGKTTLARLAFPKKPYLSLEDPDIREFAERDPRGFLRQYAGGAIIDEAQRVPALFSYLQSAVDADRRRGRFVLTGSQQFGLLSGITQSLAGRVGALILLPFTLGEVERNRAVENIETLLWRGLYPSVCAEDVPPRLWYRDYVATYVERDARQLINVRDLSAFRRFVRMCAARTGQTVNLSALAADCGVTHNTARAWLSVLEASYVVHLLQPYHRNFGKRLVKTPKLYFWDTGLACWLLGIDRPESLAMHAQRGALFETWAVAEFFKHAHNLAETPRLYFWRDSSGNEVDLVAEHGKALFPVEIKSGETIAGDWPAPLQRFRALTGAREGAIVYAGDRAQERASVAITPWRKIERLAERALQTKDAAGG